MVRLFGIWSNSWYMKIQSTWPGGMGMNIRNFGKEFETDLEPNIHIVLGIDILNWRMVMIKKKKVEQFPSFSFQIWTNSSN